MPFTSHRKLYISFRHSGDGGGGDGGRGGAKMMVVAEVTAATV